MQDLKYGTYSPKPVAGAPPPSATSGVTSAGDLSSSPIPSSSVSNSLATPHRRLASANDLMQKWLGENEHGSPSHDVPTRGVSGMPSWVGASVADRKAETQNAHGMTDAYGPASAPSVKESLDVEQWISVSVSYSCFFVLCLLWFRQVVPPFHMLVLSMFL